MRCPYQSSGYQQRGLVFSRHSNHGEGEVKFGLAFAIACGRLRGPPPSISGIWPVVVLEGEPQEDQVGTLVLTGNRDLRARRQRNLQSLALCIRVDHEDAASKLKSVSPRRSSAPPMKSTVEPIAKLVRKRVELQVCRERHQTLSGRFWARSLARGRDWQRNQ